jgi:hypothetical protein
MLKEFHGEIPTLTQALAPNLSPSFSPSSSTPSPFPCSSAAPCGADQSAGSSRLNLDSALALQRCFLHGALRSGPSTAGQYTGAGECGGAPSAGRGDPGRGPCDGRAAFLRHDFSYSASARETSPLLPGGGGGVLGAMQCAGLDAVPTQHRDMSGEVRRALAVRAATAQALLRPGAVSSNRAVAVVRNIHTSQRRLVPMSLAQATSLFERN